MKFLSRIFRRKSCGVCGKKPVKPSYYYNDKDEKIPVCYKCVEYAERRAYQKA